jgi:hypothetical protein
MLRKRSLRAPKILVISSGVLTSGNVSAANLRTDGKNAIPAHRSPESIEKYGVMVYGYSKEMTDTGQPSRASAAVSSAPAGTSGL